MKTVLAWHFTADKLRDGRPIPKVGEWLVHGGPVKICTSGLHASRDPFDALQFAPGPILHRVECQDIVAEENDKLVCRRRRIIASKDATEGLRYYARMRALSVVHLWDAPPIVLDFLMTGDYAREAVAAAARATAWAPSATARAPASAARAAAWAAWEAAAWAAREAARAAARAARETERAAARADFNTLAREAFE